MRLAILRGIPAVVSVAGISKQAELDCERKFDLNTPGVEDLLAALTAEPG